MPKNWLLKLQYRDIRLNFIGFGLARGGLAARNVRHKYEVLSFYSWKQFISY